MLDISTWVKEVQPSREMAGHSTARYGTEALQKCPGAKTDLHMSGMSGARESG